MKKDLNQSTDIVHFFTSNIIDDYLFNKETAKSANFMLEYIYKNKYIHQHITLTMPTIYT